MYYWNAAGDVEVFINQVGNVQGYIQVNEQGNLRENQQKDAQEKARMQARMFGQLIGNEIYDHAGVYVAELVETNDRCRVMVNIDKENHKYDPENIRVISVTAPIAQDLGAYGNYTDVSVKNGYRDFTQADIYIAHSFAVCSQ